MAAQTRVPHDVSFYHLVVGLLGGAHRRITDAGYTSDPEPFGIGCLRMFFVNIGSA
jgi:hypothetical protein